MIDCMKSKKLSSRRHGLTLVELLVVLVILAIMTIIAVQSTDYLVDQARFDGTQRTLQNVQNAVLGAPNQTQADGTPLLFGFQADIGRPPVVDATLQMSELWVQGALPNYQPIGTTDTNNTDVAILAGWRGPYLRLPSPNPQGQFVYDGWGNGLAHLSFANLPVVANDVVYGVRFAGASIDAATVALSTQPVTNLSTNRFNVSTNAFDFPSTIKGSVIDSDTLTAAGNALILKLYYVDFSDPANQIDAINNRWKLASINPEEDPTGTGLPAPYSYTFNPTLKNVKVNSQPLPATGNMVLRAYQTGVVPVNRSPIIRIRVPTGGLMHDVRLDLK